MLWCLFADCPSVYEAEAKVTLLCVDQYIVFFLLGCRLVSSLAKLALWFVCVVGDSELRSDSWMFSLPMFCVSKLFVTHAETFYFFPPKPRLPEPPPPSGSSPSLCSEHMSFFLSFSLSPSLSPFSLSFLPPSLLFSPVFHSYPPLYLGQAGLCYEACSGHMKPGLLEGGGFADSLPCVFVCLCVCVFVYSLCCCIDMPV